MIKASNPEELQLFPNCTNILQNISDGLAVLQEGKVEYCSPKLVEQSGYSHEALLTRPFMDFIHHADRPMVESNFRNLFGKGADQERFSFRVIHADGGPRWLSVKLMKLEWKGKPAALVLVSDFTRQKSAEEALNRQLQEQKILQEVATVCVEAATPDELLKKAIQTIGRFFFPSNFGIILLDETQRLLKVHSSYHLHRQARKVSQKIGEGIVGQVVQSGKPIRISDVTRVKNYVRADPTTRSELCVPLKIGSTILGAINAESPAENAFSEDDERLLSTSANLLAIILERLKAEEAVRANESKYRLLFEQSQHAIFLCASDSRIIDCNRQATRMLGYSKTELIDKIYKQLVAAEFHEDSRLKLAQIKKGIHLAPYEKVLIAKDGQRIPVEMTPVPVFDENGKMIWFQSMVRDITEKKEAEKLQSALYRISEVSNSARDLDQLYRAIHGIIGEMMNAQNLFIALYDADSDLLHFPYFIDQHEQQPHPHKPLKGPIGYVIRTGKPLLATKLQLRELGKRADPAPRSKPPIDWLGVPLKGYDGKVFGVLTVQSYSSKIRYTEKEEGILTFVSQQIASAIERKKNEERLRETETRFQQFEKMETIGTLVSSITHDFNNILTSIMGNAQLLHFKIPDSHPDLGKYIRAIAQASESGTGLLQQLLSFTKKEELLAEAIDLNQIIEEWKEILVRVVGDKTAMEIQLSPGLYPVFANTERVKQVLMNLVINARDAMPNGGKMVIRTEKIDFHDKKMHKNVPLKSQYYVALEIKDTGVGMDLTTVSKVFDPFFTTKPKGTGLGLTIVRRIIDQMEGFITLQSQPGRGTTFKIYIPRYQKQEETILPIKNESIVYGKGEKILLVEDDPEVRMMLSTLLRDYMRYTPVTAASGKEALHILKNTRIDLVITDIKMAEMSGIMLANKIRDLYPYLRDKVIGITACSEYNETYLKEIGFKELVFKPIKAGFLSRTIKRYL